MGFEIIKAETRTASMVGWFTGICKSVTDLLEGSVSRSKFEALAVEMEAQDFAFYTAVKKAIPTSIYNAFSFTLKTAVNASGSLTFSAGVAVTVPILIPANTQVTTNATAPETAVTYQTTADAIIAIGQVTANANIISSAAGAAGNTAANTITQLKSGISGIVSVSNPLALANGSDQETEAARRLRFVGYIATLTRGISAAQVYGAQTVALRDGNGLVAEQVISAVVAGPPATGTAGIFDLYIFNGTTGASAGLIAATQKVIDGDDTVSPPIPGYKAAGTVATVLAAITTTTAVTVSVVALAGVNTTTLEAAVRSVISGYLGAFTIGQDFVYNNLIERIMALNGVYNCTLTAPAADIVVDNSHVIIPGVVTVTVT